MSIQQMNRGEYADNSFFAGAFNASGRERIRADELTTLYRFHVLDGHGDVWVVLYFSERRADSNVFRRDTAMAWRLGSMADTLDIRTQICEELLPDDKGYVGRRGKA